MTRHMAMKDELYEAKIILVATARVFANSPEDTHSKIENGDYHLREYELDEIVEVYPVNLHQEK